TCCRRQRHSACEYLASTQPMHSANSAAPVTRPIASAASEPSDDPNSSEATTDGRKSNANTTPAPSTADNVRSMFIRSCATPLMTSLRGVPGLLDLLIDLLLLR